MSGSRCVAAALKEHLDLHPYMVYELRTLQPIAETDTATVSATIH